MIYNFELSSVKAPKYHWKATLLQVDYCPYPLLLLKHENLRHPLRIVPAFIRVGNHIIADMTISFKQRENHEVEYRLLERLLTSFDNANQKVAISCDKHFLNIYNLVVKWHLNISWEKVLILWRVDIVRKPFKLLNFYLKAMVTD